MCIGLTIVCHTICQKQIAKQFLFIKADKKLGWRGTENCVWRTGDTVWIVRTQFRSVYSVQSADVFLDPVRLQQNAHIVSDYPRPSVSHPDSYSQTLSDFTDTFLRLTIQALILRLMINFFTRTSSFLYFNFHGD